LEEALDLLSDRLLNNNNNSTVSNEDLCIITGFTHIGIKIQGAFQFYQLIRGSKQNEAMVDCDMKIKYWHHPAETINYFREDTDGTSTIIIFTDGGKLEQGSHPIATMCC
jgi:hypothetical protein